MLSFSNYCNFAYLFRFPNRFWCHWNLATSLGFSDFFSLFLRHDLIIIGFRRFLLKWFFWFPRKFFVLLWAYLYKVQIKLFLKATCVFIVDILLKISSLNWSLSYCFKLRYIDFFGLNDQSNQFQRHLPS